MSLEISDERYLRPARVLKNPFKVFSAPQGYIPWRFSTVQDARGGSGAKIYWYQPEWAFEGEPIKDPKLKTRVVRADKVLQPVEMVLRCFAELGDHLNTTQNWDPNPWVDPDNFIGAVKDLAENKFVLLTGTSEIDSIVMQLYLPTAAQALAPVLLSQAKERRGGLWIPAKRTRSNAVAFTRLRVPHK